MDGVLSYPPAECSDCGQERFIDSEIAMEEEARNREINASDDRKEEMTNE